MVIKVIFLGMSRSHGKFRAISFKLLLCCMVALNLKGISSFLSALNIPRMSANRGWFSCTMKCENYIHVMYVNICKHIRICRMLNLNKYSIFLMKLFHI